jgi:hypothetical protein
MLIELCSLDNGSGTNTNLDVYLSYNSQQKLFELRPYCKIDVADLCELLTEKQIEKLSNGQIHFNINKSKLAEKANRIY